MDKKKVLLDAAKDIVNHEHHYSCNAIFNFRKGDFRSSNKHLALKNAYADFFGIYSCLPAPFTSDDSLKDIILTRSLMLLLYRESL